ncbi:class I SAM-dependent methyltransferase [Aquabacterium humicola]|uniref:class I SAM-dependent methyltransferase n=1 Tax=Aquabacterium humicola TaxID=3237377 RepID=UPI00254311D2|nr:class I SAM-dependent methyltransferase [Rubrivivax pictus]
MHDSLPPSPWIERWAHLLRPGATALDLACGSGRHVRFLAARGLGVTAVDRDAAALVALRGVAEVIVADLEGAPWPLSGRRFDVVLVTNYLWRPLWPQLLASLAPGGLLLYETFAAGNETVGRPSRADFLLQPGELLQACAGLRIVGYEDGFLDAPPRFVQRVAALAPDPAAPSPLRVPLPS